MESTISTKITKGGQTTIPQAIRKMLGVSADDRVYWTYDDGRAYITAAPAVPLLVTSARDFWNRIDQAEREVTSGRTIEASQISSKLKAH